MVNTISIGAFCLADSVIHLSRCGQLQPELCRAYLNEDKPDHLPSFATAFNDSSDCLLRRNTERVAAVVAVEVQDVMCLGSTWARDSCIKTA